MTGPRLKYLLLALLLVPALSFAQPETIKLKTKVRTLTPFIKIENNQIYVCVKPQKYFDIFCDSGGWISLTDYVFSMGRTYHSSTYENGELTVYLNGV